MKTVTVTNFRNNLFNLINETVDESEPIQITGKKKNVILISEDDWRSIQETLFLISVPRMREKIIEGMNTPAEECSDKLEW
jgi:prevent-host-death family protein